MKGLVFNLLFDTMWLKGCDSPFFNWWWQQMTSAQCAAMSKRVILVLTLAASLAKREPKTAAPYAHGRSLTCMNVIFGHCLSCTLVNKRLVRPHGVCGKQVVFLPVSLYCHACKLKIFCLELNTICWWRLENDKDLRRRTWCFLVTDTLFNNLQEWNIKKMLQIRAVATHTWLSVLYTSAWHLAGGDMLQWHVYFLKIRNMLLNLSDGTQISKQIQPLK